MRMNASLSMAALLLINVGMGMTVDAPAQSTSSTATRPLPPEIGSSPRSDAAGRSGGRIQLHVRTTIVSSCELTSLSDTGSVAVRCTPGVPHRSILLGDADPRFQALSPYLAPVPAPSDELVPIHAKKLFVEF